jgi:hypothetical protein
MKNNLVDKVEFDNLVDEIMDTFDFEKVQRVMNFLNWNWDKPGYIPTVIDLRKELRSRIKSLWMYSLLKPKCFSLADTEAFALAKI